MNDGAPPVSFAVAPDGHWAHVAEAAHVLTAQLLIRALAISEPGDTMDQAWDAAAEVSEEMLAPLERLRLLAYAIRACPRDEAIDLMDSAVRELAVMPPPAFGPLRDCAEQWAAWASPAEVKAYLLACFHRLEDGQHLPLALALARRLTKAEQARLLRLVQKEALA